MLQLYQPAGRASHGRVHSISPYAYSPIQPTACYAALLPVAGCQQPHRAAAPLPGMQQGILHQRRPHGSNRQCAAKGAPSLSSKLGQAVSPLSPTPGMCLLIGVHALRQGSCMKPSNSGKHEHLATSAAWSCTPCYSVLHIFSSALMHPAVVLCTLLWCAALVTSAAWF
jgi:hypothetical protein